MFFVIIDLSITKKVGNFQNCSTYVHVLEAYLLYENVLIKHVSPPFEALANGLLKACFQLNQGSKIRSNHDNNEQL